MVAVFTFDRADIICNGVITFFQVVDSSFGAVGHHYLMDNERAFIDLTYNVTRCYIGAVVYGRLKVPFLLSIQTGHGDTAAHKSALSIIKRVERSLDAVIDALNQTRPQFHAQRGLGVYNRFARPDTNGLFVNLNRRKVPVKLYYLTDEVELAHSHDVVHS